MNQRPVVMVHGIFDTSAAFDKLSRHLEQRGFTGYSPTLRPEPPDIGLDDLALRLQGYISEQLGDTQQFDLIGFSMGGLVTRFYTQRLGGAERIGRLITISAPHNGTQMAWLNRTKVAEQMRPGSKFLEDLNADAHTLAKVRIASLWTPLDLMIVPPSSSRLAVATELVFPVVAHPLMLSDRRCLKAVADLLEE